MGLAGCACVRTQRKLHAGEYRAAIPPVIAHLELRLSAELSAESEDALREIVRFDEYASQRLGPTTELAPMSSILLRSESAASSQIENLTVGTLDRFAERVAERDGRPRQPRASAILGARLSMA